MNIESLVSHQDKPTKEGQGIILPTELIQKPFVEAIRDIGGAYLGVATHQNFTYIAAARSREAFIVDRSSLAIKTLKAHRQVHLHKDTPEQYLDFWSRQPRQMIDEVNTWGLEAGELAEMASIIVPYGKKIGLVLYFDRSDAIQKPESRKCSWLSSLSDYAFIREMFGSGKINILNADLQNERVMGRIGARVRQDGLTFSTFYLSNVEDHLAGKIQEVPPGDINHFWRNLQLLPTSDKAVILRTIRTFGNISPDGIFYYVVQPMDNFLGMNYRSYDHLLQDISGQITKKNLGVTVMPVPREQRDGYLVNRDWNFP